MAFREQIKAARKRLKLTQKTASEAWGVPFRTLQNWEAGNRQPPEWVVQLILEKISQKP